MQTAFWPTQGLLVRESAQGKKSLVHKYSQTLPIAAGHCLCKLTVSQKPPLLGC